MKWGLSQEGPNSPKILRYVLAGLHCSVKYLRGKTFDFENLKVSV